MHIGVLGTGMVGKAIATRLVELGHEVTMGSRAADGSAVTEWAQSAGDAGHAGTFADAAAAGELVFNCTNGAFALDAVTAASKGGLDGKVLIDVANPLDFSDGFPPTLSIKDTDSLAEAIQRAVPQARVVKALNTMNADIMVAPETLGAEHNVFICGDDADARDAVRRLLGEFGWTASQIIDLGGLEAARGTEMFLPLWLRIYQARGDGAFNIAVTGAG